MACPYFMPVERLESGSWPHPARLPLGCGWAGHCTAPGHERETPQADVLEAFCNLGYASGCSWAPLERPWDAVRFAVSAPSGIPEKKRQNPAAVELPTSIYLRYVCERAHLPVEHGELEYNLRQSVWTRRHYDDRVQKMAECFLEAYQRKRS